MPFAICTLYKLFIFLIMLCLLNFWWCFFFLFNRAYYPGGKPKTIYTAAPSNTETSKAFVWDTRVTHINKSELLLLYVDVCFTPLCFCNCNYVFFFFWTTHDEWNFWNKKVVLLNLCNYFAMMVVNVFRLLFFCIGETGASFLQQGIFLTVGLFLKFNLPISTYVTYWL